MQYNTFSSWIPLRISAALISESIPANAGADAEVPDTPANLPPVEDI